MDLGIADDDLASCVSCGLCLPHCPTYRVTGEEALSPRGRIAAMRRVQWDGADPDASFVASVETCVQCRGCETACPSGVPYGRLVEPTRATVAAAVRPPPRLLALGLRALRWHRLVLAGSTLLAAAQRLRLVPPRVARRVGLPARLPLRRPRLRPTPRGGSAGRAPVRLFTGCVMDAWQRDVHVDVVRVVEAAGGAVALPGPSGACCGALAQHAGMAGEARARARATLRALPGSDPILVDSAGCGAMLADYGHLLGTPEAHAFAARVVDVHTWLADRVDRLVAAAGTHPGARPRVAVQDPCHLRHVQHAHGAVRTVLGPFADVVELDDEGLCCGAGGAYAAVQPALAGAVRDRKLAAIARSGAPLVASANPGCALHLAAGGADVAHPCQIVAAALPHAVHS